jgi:DNA-binding LacI/PurR family transcriptional regulator
MTKKEILEAAEANAMNYCIQRGMAKAAFIDGALWAMKQTRSILEDAKAALDAENTEFDFGHNVNHESYENEM